jgi:hypothetical protein
MVWTAEMLFVCAIPGTAVWDPRVFSLLASARRASWKFQKETAYKRRLLCSRR